MLTKPRTVWACHFIAAIISANVAPLERFNIAITSAFLLARCDFGLPACFLARVAIFAGLAFFADGRLAFGCGASAAGAFFSDSVEVFISFLLDRAAVVTIHRSGREKHQGKHT